MDFAKKQLEKYGWQEGKGLGKNETGITTAIKPKLKFDNAGVGHDSSEQFTNNWWERLYNNASSNLNVSNSVNGNVQVNVSDPDGVEITTKNYSVKGFKKNSSSPLEYGTFCKTSKLTESGIVDFSKNDRILTTSDTRFIVRPLSDDELFAACGGRTAHKGARHCLNSNGKLSRIEKQEKLLLKRMRKVSLSDAKDCKENLEKKLRKINNHKDRHSSESMEEGSITDSPIGNQVVVGCFTSPHKNSKNRKKEKKKVSFSETVTEYQTQEVDSSTSENQGQNDAFTFSDSCSSKPSTPVITVRKLEIKAENKSPNLCVPDQDEGVEADGPSFSLHAMIKEDNYKMKRKLKKFRKRNNSEEYVKYIKNDDENAKKLDIKCIKRKIIMDEGFLSHDSKRHCDVTDDVKLNLRALFSEDPKKKEYKQKKRQRRLEKRINRVADSLNALCKISDVSK